MSFAGIQHVEKITPLADMAWVAILNKLFNASNTTPIMGRVQCWEDIIGNSTPFLTCMPKYEKERDKLRKKVALGGMKLEKLLGDHRTRLSL